MQRTAEFVVYEDFPSKLQHKEPSMTSNAYNRKVAAIHKLRVNIKSLATESRLIRHECTKASPRYVGELDGHRRGRLREESRYAHLALAFVRGSKYSSTEKTNLKVDKFRLMKKLATQGVGVEPLELAEWLSS